ncbi:glycosyltransferase [Actinomycetes bacterium NPDC127524]
MKKRVYIPVLWKFYISHLFAVIWTCIAIVLSKSWISDLSGVAGITPAVIIITGIAYIPGYLNAFLVASLLIDKQPKLKTNNPQDDITVLIAAKNEENGIANSLIYLKNQDYDGNISVVLIDNGSEDGTIEAARKIAQEINLDLSIKVEEEPGKHAALNQGIKYVNTEYVITLDADTLLHKSAIRYIVARMKSAPPDVCAVAGAILVRNSRENLWSRVQEWDYFLSIASIKRLQGLYQGTLVAQGAYSLFKTDTIREAGGWPDAIGEDIVLTWKFLKQGRKVFFEPLSVAFTEVPTKLIHLGRQRSRWARGMIEGLKEVKPWQQPSIYTKYLTSVNYIMPFIDISFTFFWLPGLVLAFFGVYWIVGLTTLLVLPLTFVSYFVLYFYQKKVFTKLNLKIRRNISGFIVFVLFYQMIMSPVSVWGYVQELFKLKRVWK